MLLKPPLSRRSSKLVTSSTIGGKALQKRTIDPRVGSNKLDRSSELNTESSVDKVLTASLAIEYDFGRAY